MKTMSLLIHLRKWYRVRRRVLLAVSVYVYVSRIFAPERAAASASAAHIRTSSPRRTRTMPTWRIATVLNNKEISSKIIRVCWLRGQRRLVNNKISGDERNSIEQQHRYI